MAKCMVRNFGVHISSREIEFKRLLFNWAEKIQVKPKRVRFQKMTNKWASCSAAGQITFNTALLRKPRKFQEAVIVHELIHLIIPNHGKLFKSMFLSFAPEGEKDLKAGD